VAGYDRAGVVRLEKGEGAMRLFLLGVVIVSAMSLHLVIRTEHLCRRIDELAIADQQTFGSFEAARKYWRGVAAKQPESL